MEQQRTESSLGVRVPSVADVKGEQRSFLREESESRPTKLEVDKDFLCPICIQTMKDAFLTSCGHSFCYMCIMTHLNNKKNCPCCGLYLTKNQLFPNFLLNKLLTKALACQLVNKASPSEHLKVYLQQGAEVSVKELDRLLSLLTEKKRKAEQEEAETNMEVLLDFLHRLREQRQEELHELQTDLQFIKEDISTVERQRHEIIKARQRFSLKLRLRLDGPSPNLGHVAVENSISGGVASISSSGQGGATVAIVQETGQSNSLITHKKNNSVVSISDMQGLPPSVGLRTARKKRVLAQFDDLQECYLQRRRRIASVPAQKRFDGAQEKDKDGNSSERDTLNAVKPDGNWSERDPLNAGIEDFQAVLNAFTRYSRLRVIAEIRPGDILHSSNIVLSIEFDRDDELFATAGVSRRIKVFEFATVVNELADAHCPVVEMSTRSKLSCLSWNKHIKSQIASSDYEGIVTVWDVNTRQSIVEYEEHEKRAWSVDFSRTEPSMLVSGSDDGKVKVWCTNQETSVLNIDMKANVCSVKYNPGFSNYVAVGSADHHIYYYDLRNIHIPLHVFNGHRKAVSYAKFISPNELASASTDSTLRLWDVKENCLMRTLKGHMNEKNFVGLTVNSEYVACGSETNEVFVYHKAMSKPTAWHRFGSADIDDSDDDTSHFISAVCWKSESPTMLAANSQGTVKVLVLAP